MTAKQKKEIKAKLMAEQKALHVKFLFLKIVQGKNRETFLEKYYRETNTLALFYLERDDFEKAEIMIKKGQYAIEEFVKAKNDTHTFLTDKDCFTPMTNE